MKINFWKTMFIVAAAALFVLPACSNDDEVKDDADRLFSPVELSTNFDGTTVTLTWLPITGAVSYDVDLSRDSLDFTNDVQSFSDVEEATLVIPDLMGGERYSVRVKANAENSAKDSKFTEITFVTPSENILYQLQGEDVGSNDVNLSWDPEKAVTKIVITPAAGGTPLEFELAEADKTAGEKFCDGLEGETDYVAEIFNGEAKRGAVSFKTQIDIGDATLIQEGDDLIAIINEAGSGTFVVEGGEYNVSSGEMELTGSTTIKALNAAAKPVIYGAVYIGGNGSYLLENLDFSGYTIDVETGELNMEDRLSYATRVTTDVVTQGELIVKDCSFTNFDRSLLRGTEGGAFDKVEFDNIVVDNVTLGNNEFIDLRSCAVGQVTLKNSTVSNSSVGRHFMRCDDIAGFTGQVITIENCTFHNIAMPANRFLYIRVVDNQATVKNNVFSQMAVANESDPEVNWDGAEFRVDDPATGFPVIDFNYFYKAGKLAEYEVNGPNNITDNDGDSPFADFENGDFTVDVNSDIRTSGEGNGAMGDPRWTN
jgi:hypothetical protein